MRTISSFKSIICKYQSKDPVVLDFLLANVVSQVLGRLESKFSRLKTFTQKQRYSFLTQSTQNFEKVCWFLISQVLLCGVLLYADWNQIASRNR